MAKVDGGQFLENRALESTEIFWAFTLIHVHLPTKQIFK